MYTFDYLQNSLPNTTAGSLTILKRGNYLFNFSYTLGDNVIIVQNKKNDSKIGIKTDGSNNSFLFDKDTNSYISLQNSSFLIPSTCILGDIYKPLQFPYDPDSYTFNYIDSITNSFAKGNVYKESDFGYPAYVKEFMNNYCVPQNLVIAGMSNILKPYGTTVNQLIYIEMVGALECSFKAPANNQWVSSLTK